jgi:hypothetical protein
MSLPGVLFVKPQKELTWAVKNLKLKNNREGLSYFETEIK